MSFKLPLNLKMTLTNNLIVWYSLFKRHCLHNLKVASTYNQLVHLLCCWFYLISDLAFWLAVLAVIPFYLVGHPKNNPGVDLTETFRCPRLLLDRHLLWQEIFLTCCTALSTRLWPFQELLGLSESHSHDIFSHSKTLAPLQSSNYNSAKEPEKVCFINFHYNF